MSDLRLEKTYNTPEIDFRSNGILNMEGRILSDNAITTFAPLFNWVKDFNAKNVLFSINLDYINTSSTKQLFNFLKIIDENPDIESVKVIWHYEEDDDDHLETGEFYQDKLKKTDFEFVMVRI